MDKLYNDILKLRSKLEIFFWTNVEVQDIYKSIVKQIKKINVPKNEDDIEIFVKDNRHILYKLYDTFLGEYSITHVPESEKQKISGSIYKILNNCDIEKPTTFYTYTPSKIFNEFIKGITYFESENPVEEGKLNYHRLKSCGSFKLKANQKFNSEESKQEVKKCYIERLF
jgi:hypothetical protein